MPPINPIDDIRRSAARASSSSRPSWAADPAAKSKVSENTPMAGKMTWKISISKLRIQLKLQSGENHVGLDLVAEHPLSVKPLLDTLEDLVERVGSGA